MLKIINTFIYVDKSRIVSRIQFPKALLACFGKDMEVKMLVDDPWTSSRFMKTPQQWRRLSQKRQLKVSNLEG